MQVKNVSTVILRVTLVENVLITGVDPGYQVRGGGAHLKKNCIERREAQAFMSKNHIFSNFRGGGGAARRVHPPLPPGSTPGLPFCTSIFLVGFMLLNLCFFVWCFVTFVLLAIALSVTN